eukprot:TRINITY_DN72651_c0_g1_i1.p1 TRINITY_DN72651_c0_g1~~TRINITY_DN72651_c0_g1_i1.p1  ORF type:complete len:512 (-),score=55.08 TRINITY_DN72651_c0_g1_i1:124-1659(-)
MSTMESRTRTIKFGKSPRGEPVQLHVLRINLLQLQSIDQIHQTVSARLFIQLSIPQGGLDEDLCRDLYDEEPKFPADTLRPGAAWFMHQIDFPTAVDYQIISRKVVKMYEDLHMIIKLQGTFFERMELGDFPFDIQQLKMTMSFNCAAEGVVPVAFANVTNAALSIDMDTFALSNMWTLFPFLRVDCIDVTPMPATTYPAITLKAVVARRPGFFIHNVFFPMCVLTSLSILQFLIPGHQDKVDARIHYSSTIVLTSATYKLFVSNHLPTISYMTVIDIYLLVCFILQAFVVAAAAVFGALVIERSEEEAKEWNLPDWATSLYDVCTAIVLTTLFLLFHILFAWYIWCRRQLNLRRVRYLSRQADPEKACPRKHTEELGSKFANYRVQGITATMSEALEPLPPDDEDDACTCNQDETTISKMTSDAPSTQESTQDPALPKTSTKTSTKAKSANRSSKTKKVKSNVEADSPAGDGDSPPGTPKAGRELESSAQGAPPSDAVKPEQETPAIGQE